MTSNHFRNRWQESHEEALRVAQDAHCQVLVAAAQLEGHIERLGCSISHGWSATMGNQVVTGVGIVEDTQEAAGGAQWLVIESRSPQWQATLGIL